MESAYEGRHIVVTGASGSLGRAVATALAERGAVCHLPIRGETDSLQLPDSLASRVQVAGGVDLADERAVAAFYGALPGLWASIHCAGRFSMQPLSELGDAEYRALLDANLTTCALCCREAVRAIRSHNSGNGRRGLGRIVNLTAQTALDPRRGAGMGAYAAAKAGVAALTVALAEELAEEAIWVNAVAPSILDTRANREAMPRAEHDQWASLGEVTETILFLAAPANLATRGAIVPVYGRS
jgi:NAD(P)-dependent dehydrogenase (short-subunit alcohol dehydrogenase family)